MTNSEAIDFFEEQESYWSQRYSELEKKCEAMEQVVDAAKEYLKSPMSVTYVNLGKVVQKLQVKSESLANLTEREKD